MSRSIDVTTRSLDLVARNIDLVSTLVDSTTTSGGLLNLGIQIGEWLQHEKVNRHELKDCFERAYGLAWPNVNGEIFRNEVRTKPAIKPLLPLFLQHSGSLGRLLVFDEGLCWIVSTIGCLLNYHGEIWVTTILTTIIAKSQAKSQSSRAPPFEIGRIQIMSVVKKIVSSVWYNIVNAGTETMGLPDALANICTVGHQLPPELLGRVIVALQQHKLCTVVRSHLLYQNLTLWILLHFHGRFTVTVSGKIVFQENVGHASVQQSELELRVATFCRSSDSRHSEPGRACLFPQQHNHIEVLGNIAGNFEEFLDERIPHPGVLPQTDAQTRQELYNLKPSSLTGRPGLPESSKIWARCTAQEITRWVLNLSVSTETDGLEGYAFGVRMNPKVSSEAKGPSWKFADVLKRMPGILNKKWGNRPSSLVCAERVENPNSDESENETEAIPPPASRIQNKLQSLGIECLLPHFPILRELANNVRGQCECIMCTSEVSNKETERPIKAGCFQHLALSEVLILLSHAIADAFGVDNTSARRASDTLIELMILLLLEIVEERRVRWDCWFYLAGTVLLGCPIKESGDTFGDGTICALQYGSLAAVAGWLDMNKEQKIPGSFSLIYGEGKLGTMSEGNDGNQFRGLVSDFAIVKTSEMFDVHDNSKTKCDCILVSLGKEDYRLLTRVMSDTHSRIIDPREVMSQHTRGVPVLSKKSECHEHGRCGPNLSLPDSVVSYSFDEILGRWPEDGSSNFLVSQVLDTDLKLNVAYALSGGRFRGVPRVMSTSGNPCVQCLVAYYRSQGADGDESTYIINAASHAPRRKRMISSVPTNVTSGSDDP